MAASHTDAKSQEDNQKENPQTKSDETDSRQEEERIFLEGLRCLLHSLILVYICVSVK